MDEVESIFTKHFANNDRKKTMKFLRPQRQRESHMVTFFVGNDSFPPPFSLIHKSNIHHYTFHLVHCQINMEQNPEAEMNEKRIALKG